MEFASERNGYKKQEVDTYIESLQKELLQWKNRCIKAEGDYFAIKEKQEELMVKILLLHLLLLLKKQSKLKPAAKMCTNSKFNRYPFFMTDGKCF